MTANVNEETGIAYGVIDARNVPFLMEDIIDKGTDETYEAMLKMHINTLTTVFEEMGMQDAHETAEQVVGDATFDVDMDENEYSYEDEDGNKFLLGHLGGAPLIWCVKTDRLIYASACSPCVPNAGDLDSLVRNSDRRNIRCYSVPTGYLDEDSEDHETIKKAYKEYDEFHAEAISNE